MIKVILVITFTLTTSSGAIEKQYESPKNFFVAPYNTIEYCNAIKKLLDKDVKNLKEVPEGVISNFKLFCEVRGV